MLLRMLMAPGGDHIHDSITHGTWLQYPARNHRRDHYDMVFTHLTIYGNAGDGDIGDVGDNDDAAA